MGEHGKTQEPLAVAVDPAPAAVEVVGGESDYVGFPAGATVNPGD